MIDNDEIVNDDIKISEIFSDYFGNVVSDLDIAPYVPALQNNSSDDPIIGIITKYRDHPSIRKIKENISDHSSFCFKPLEINAVMDEIFNLKLSKSVPVESIPTKIVKDNNNIFGPKILIDFNSSIQNGIFPSNQKFADITPIFKNTDKNDKHNYRPVSILPVLSKIFERLMFHQINIYMQEKLSIFLCGFRKGMSAQNCLLFMVEKWRRHLDRCEKGGVLLTDLSKAFDCLWHDLLIAKLHAYGFDYNSLKLILSYLSDRFQRVRVNGSFSKWMKIIYGVPQGSILGAPLFNIYSNDIFFLLIFDIANYADDNSPFTFGENIPAVVSQLESEGASLLQWVRNNGLKANPDKFHMILSETSTQLSMMVDNFEIKNSQTEKMLGIKIDNKLTFDPHVSDLCSKVSQKLHALSRVSQFMPLERRKELMNAFILSQFGYCPLVWMLHSRKLNHRINSLHERALRIVFKDTVSTFSELLEKNGSFKIHERNVQNLAIELYKVWHGLSPKIMNLIFPITMTPAIRGQNCFSSRNIKSANYGTDTLAHLAPKIWKLVPNEWKTLSLSKFISNIRKWKPACPCKLCKVYIQGVGYIENISN